MTTYQRKSILYEVISGNKIPPRILSYFRARLSNRIHSLMLEEFARLEESGQISKAELARRIGREPAQITRWLSSAANLTTDTLSDLLLGMKCEPNLSISSLVDMESKRGAKENLGQSNSMDTFLALETIPLDVQAATTAIEASRPPAAVEKVEKSAHAAARREVQITRVPGPGVFSYTFGTQQDQHSKREKVAA